MTKWIAHILVFIFVAGLVIVTFTNTDSKDGTSAVYQLPVLMLAGVYLGGLFIMYLLPAITDKATHMLYNSGEQVEHDPLYDARAAHARGDYDDAIAVYLSVTHTDPENRLPWVEIAKIQHNYLEDPDAAIFTLRNALESRDWAVNDAAYFMNRLSEIYIEDKDDKESGVNMLHQIIETFPETRHSANATHKLREMGEV